VSPKRVKEGKLSPIAERVLNVQRNVFYATGHVKKTQDPIVIARRAELVVHADARDASSAFDTALRKVAEPVGDLATIRRRSTALVASPRQRGRQLERDYRPNPKGPLSKVEIWRLKDTTNTDSINASRRLRKHLKGKLFALPGEPHPLHPGIHPHHTAILAPTPGGCPATPPAPAGTDGTFVKGPSRGSTAKVTVLDSGYIWIDPPHRNLDRRVTVVHGQWLDTERKRWEPDEPDDLYTNPAGQLDGISGHGTFIAGLISHIAPRTRLEVVGLRNQEVEIAALTEQAQLGLFETEAAIAHAMLRRCNTDVLQCGFAFPTLDDFPSLPFAAVMAELRSDRAPRKGVAVVAPAGNEHSRGPYWPAALPGVIGVAATDPKGGKPAWFSNWGDWCDCCTGGEDIYSTFVNWNGPIEGESPNKKWHFNGWATWNGTSFAAPKVSAEIARRFAASRRPTTPADVANRLVAGAGAWTSDKAGVRLPYLQIP